MTAISGARSKETRRIRGLVGTRMLPLTLSGSDRSSRDPVGDADWSVLYCYPGAYATASAYPDRWSEIPGATGCTLDALTFRDRIDEFAARDAQIVGVSTQRPEEQAAFATKTAFPYTVRSDQDLQMAAALRLPTFRAAGRDYLKRLTLIVQADRRIRHVLYPMTDVLASIDLTLALLDQTLVGRKPTIGRPRS